MIEHKDRIDLGNGFSLRRVTKGMNRGGWAVWRGENEQMYVGYTAGTSIAKALWTQAEQIKALEKKLYESGYDTVTAELDNSLSREATYKEQIEALREVAEAAKAFQDAVFSHGGMADQSIALTERLAKAKEVGTL